MDLIDRTKWKTKAVHDPFKVGLNKSPPSLWGIPFFTWGSKHVPSSHSEQLGNHLATLTTNKNNLSEQFTVTVNFSKWLSTYQLYSNICWDVLFGEIDCVTFEKMCVWASFLNNKQLGTWRTRCSFENVHCKYRCIFLLIRRAFDKNLYT